MTYSLLNHSSLNIIRVLSHEYCIPSRVDIYVGTSSNSDVENDNPNSKTDGDDRRLRPDCKFRRLGYMKFSENEESGFKARELKSVNVSCMANYVKVRNSVRKVIFEGYNNNNIIIINLILII